MNYSQRKHIERLLAASEPSYDFDPLVIWPSRFAGINEAAVLASSGAERDAGSSLGAPSLGASPSGPGSTLQASLSAAIPGASAAEQDAFLLRGSGWIDLNGRRPEPEVFVLAWDGKRVSIDWWGSLFRPNGTEYTHWLPFPAPPGAGAMYGLHSLGATQCTTSASSGSAAGQLRSASFASSGSCGQLATARAQGAEQTGSSPSASGAGSLGSLSGAQPVVTSSEAHESGLTYRSQEGG